MYNHHNDDAGTGRPGRSGPGLLMNGPERARALQITLINGPGRAVMRAGRAGPGKLGPCTTLSTMQ